MFYSITAYQPPDHPALCAFLRAAFLDLGHTFDPATKDADLQDIPAHYQFHGGLFLLARHANEVVATIALRPLTPTIGELKRFYVRRDRRRQGLGSTLLARAIAHAQTQPWHALRLDTSRKSPALSLFRKHGFIEIGRYNDDPYADTFLELPLKHADA